MTFPAPGVVGTFTRTPDTSIGLQFDGQVSTLVTVFNAAVQTVGAAGIQLTVFFGPDDLIDSVAFTGGGLPRGMSFNRMDWVLLPQDGSTMLVIKDGEFQANWAVQ